MLDGENLFDKEFDIDKEKKEVKSPREPKIPQKKPKKRNEANENLAVNYGIQELECLHNAYLEFISEVKDLVIMKPLRQYMLVFGKACEHMDCIINGDLENAEIPGIDSDKAREIFIETRTILLQQLYDKYKLDENR